MTSKHTLIDQARALTNHMWDIYTDLLDGRITGEEAHDSIKQFDAKRKILIKQLRTKRIALANRRGKRGTDGRFLKSYFGSAF